MTAQPLFPPADEVGVRDHGVVEEYLVEHRMSPVISRSGRIVTPGWSSGKANHEIPACLGTSKSVRASSIP